MWGLFFGPMVEYSFTDDQKILVYNEAHRRQTRNEQKGRGGRNYAPSRGSQALGMHLIGCAAEVAVANYLGLEAHLFKDTDPVRGEPDLPGMIEVKCRSNHSYDLLIFLDDNPEKNFVLVTAANAKTYIHGWISGRDAMKQEYIKEYRKNSHSYAVKQDLLRPIAELKEIVNSPEWKKQNL